MTKLPEYQHQEEFQNRTRKLAEIRQVNVEPYPNKYTPTHTALDIHQRFNEAEVGHSDDAAAGTTEPVRVAGRLVLFRPMGKNAFAHLQDETGRLQIMLNRDTTQIAGYETEGQEEEDVSL